ncbi:hypothetical protein RQV66_001236 [Vibrio alginolyticus]|nr:hypothetical protein [Vibrio alginolyticus]ELI1833432.1 hypothetical protein [Vibrio alginolyticus]
MVGFSFETCAGLILSLFIILFISPAGLKKTTDQVISAQVYYGSTYLALSFSLCNVLAFIWLFNNGVVYPSANVPMNIWAAIVSSTFGALYWTHICLFFIKKKRTISGWVNLLLWPVLMFFLNYLPETYRCIVNSFEILSLSSKVIDLVLTAVIIVILIVLNFGYFKLKPRWVEL